MTIETPARSTMKHGSPSYYGDLHYKMVDTFHHTTMSIESGKSIFFDVQGQCTAEEVCMVAKETIHLGYWNSREPPTMIARLAVTKRLTMDAPHIVLGAFMFSHAPQNIDVKCQRITLKLHTDRTAELAAKEEFYQQWAKERKIQFDVEYSSPQ